MPDPEVGILTLREDPRVVVLRADHPLAARAELTVEDVLSEPFYGTHPTVAPDWAAFWNLDENRGGPAATTGDRASNTLEQVAAMTSGQAISTYPAPVAAVIVDLVPDLLALPLVDASPASCALVWHRSRPSSVVADLVSLAREMMGPSSTAAGALASGETRLGTPDQRKPARRARGASGHAVEEPVSSISG